MSRLNRTNIENSPCAQLSQSPPSCYFVTTNNQSNPTSPGSSSNSPGSTGSSSANGNPSQNQSGSGRRLPVNVFNAMGYLDELERESEANNFDMLKPLLMLNMESIQTLRADCRYKRSRR